MRILLFHNPYLSAINHCNDSQVINTEKNNYNFRMNTQNKNIRLNLLI